MNCSVPAALGMRSCRLNGRTPSLSRTGATVKVPARLATAAGEHARISGRTISAVVAQALGEFFTRDRRNHPRR
jgi:hypothetical protein